MPVFSASIFFCIVINRGKAIFIRIVITTIKIGAITPIIIARLALICVAIMTAPISIPGARSIIISDIRVIFCSCVTSLVSLVTREPVWKWSRLAKEKVCTFL